jgi:hypothetical protein
MQPEISMSRRWWLNRAQKQSGYIGVQKALEKAQSRETTTDSFFVLSVHHILPFTLNLAPCNGAIVNHELLWNYSHGYATVHCVPLQRVWRCLYLQCVCVCVCVYCVCVCVVCRTSFGGVGQPAICTKHQRLFRPNLRRWYHAAGGIVEQIS